MTTLLIESNEKLIIEQMEFELPSSKLELELCAQVQTTQLIIAKMLLIFYMLLSDSNICKHVILYKKTIHSLFKIPSFHHFISKFQNEFFFGLQIVWIRSLPCTPMVQILDQCNKISKIDSCISKMDFMGYFWHFFHLITKVNLFLFFKLRDSKALLTHIWSKYPKKLTKLENLMHINPKWILWEFLHSFHLIT